MRPSIVKPGATVIDVGINRVTDRCRGRGAVPESSPRRGDFDKRGAVVVGDVHPGGRRGRRRPHAGARRRRSADHRVAASKHGHRAPSTESRDPRGADRRHRQRQEPRARGRLRSAACRPSTPTAWRTTRLAPATPGAAAVVARFGDRRRRRRRRHRSPRAGAHRLQRRCRPPRSRSNRASRRLQRDRPLVRVAARPTRLLRVADIPLLFETGHESDFDVVIVAACSPEEQLRRAMARDRLSRRRGAARLAAQWPIDEKVRRADYVIWTTGSFEETEAQIREVDRAVAYAGPKLQLGPT